MMHTAVDYDALFLDLDGTVFAGDRLIPGALEGFEGHDRMFITNNASRSPNEVVEHLRSLGVDAEPNEVLTSAQAACELAWAEFSFEGQQPKALVLGSESFREIARARGFNVLSSAAENPDVVLQGHSPSIGWAELSEATLAINHGARFIASNLDTTLPSSRGFLVGNGSMVAAVRTATGVEPLSAGKPGPEMFHTASKISGAQRPLVVGDRLDTDIAGGRAAGLDTLLVLTGVSTHWDVLFTEFRPSHIRAFLNQRSQSWSASVEEEGIVLVHSAPLVGSSGAEAPDATVTDEPDPARLQILAAAALEAAAPVAWRLLDEGLDPQALQVRGADPVAQQALENWRR